MSTSPSDTFDQLARRAARRKLGWYVHALAYVCVNLALLAISFSHGRHWALLPLFGRGIALHSRRGCGSRRGRRPAARDGHRSQEC